MWYYVEVVWNREFDWAAYGGGQETLEKAIQAATEAANSGDGARVKKSRVVSDDGRVLWQGGRPTRTT